MNDPHEMHKGHHHEAMDHGQHTSQPQDAVKFTDSSQPTHAGHEMHGAASSLTNEHANHADHSGHEDVFRKRFWVSLLLSIPVLLYTPMLQMWFGFMMPEFVGSRWVMPLFAVIVFVYGGVPFIQMAVPEIRNRQPGMMLLISLAISVSFIYSLAALFFNLGEGFFWELVTLIDIMLLGHWIEMRSVRQASEIGRASW